jgi:hypothetical protein
MALAKYRYEFPPLEGRFVEAPSPRAVVEYIKRTYPHNWEEVLPTMVSIPDDAWQPDERPRYWKTLNQDGRALPPNKI